MFKIIAGDVGGYGQDIKSNIIEIVRSLLNQEGDFRLTLLDFGPEWFVKYSSELIELFASNKERITSLMLPIQSGSDRILNLMRRRYKIDQVRDSIQALRQVYPEVLLSTHVLIGFPGESDEDFQKTIKFLRQVCFQRVDIYEYSDRPHIDAGNLQHQVPIEVIKKKSLKAT